MPKNNVLKKSPALPPKLSFPLILILLLGAGLRLTLLGKYDLWYDEAYSLHFPLSIIQNAPLYYMFFHFWTQPLLFLQVTSRWLEFFCRLPSALFSFSCLPVLYMIARRTCDRNSALYATLLLALSPLQLWYAQEARPYALTTLLALLSILFFTDYLQKNEDLSYNKHTVLYVLFATLGLYTHYLFAFLPLLCLAYALYLKKPAHQLIQLFLPFLFWLPWFPLISQQLSVVAKGFWPSHPTFESLRITFENCLLGYNGTSILYKIADFLLILLGILFFYNMLQKKEKKYILVFYALLFIFPVFCTFLLSKFSVSVYIDRNFSIFIPFFFLLITNAICALNKKILRFSFLSILIILLAFSDVRYFLGEMYEPQDMRHHIGVHPKKPMRPIVEYFVRNFNKYPKNTLIITHPAVIFPMHAYYFLLNKTGSSKIYFDLSRYSSFVYFAFDPKFNDTIYQRPYTEIYLNNGKPSWFTDYFISKERIYEDIIKTTPGKIFLVGCDWARSSRLDENSQSIKDFLDSRLKLSEKLDFDGIILSVYKT